MYEILYKQNTTKREAENRNYRVGNKIKINGNKTCRTKRNVFTKNK
jgi:hypothetical protein